MRANYLLPAGIGAWRGAPTGQDIDYVLLINTNPRYEGSLLNIRMRQLVLGSRRAGAPLIVATIGSPMDLTYPIDHLGNGAITPYQMAQGKHAGLLQLIKSHSPRYILGFGALSKRFDSSPLVGAIHTLSARAERVRKNAFAFKDKGAGGRSRHAPFGGRSLEKGGCDDLLDKKQTQRQDVHILHPYANTAGALDLGFVPGRASLWSRASRGGGKLVYLLGVPMSAALVGPTSDFIIYQGHHGDSGAAKFAHVILPSTCYVEKNATYVNTQGRVQETKMAIPPLLSSRDD